MRQFLAAWTLTRWSLPFLIPQRCVWGASKRTEPAPFPARQNPAACEDDTNARARGTRVPRSDGLSGQRGWVQPPRVAGLGLRLGALRVFRSADRSGPQDLISRLDVAATLQALGRVARRALKDSHRFPLPLSLSSSGTPTVSLPGRSDGNELLAVRLPGSLGDGFHCLLGDGLHRLGHGLRSCLRRRLRLPVSPRRRRASSACLCLLPGLPGLRADDQRR